MQKIMDSLKVIIIFLILISIPTNGARNVNEYEKSKLPTHFVLVHGASHGGWCWYKIRTLLESLGYKVSSPDLRSAGIDPSDADTIFTFQDYNKPLDDLLANLPAGEKVILVGHSVGGLSLTEAIHHFPEKIQVAVFVAAAMLRNGFLTQQDKEDGAPNLSKIGDIYDYGYGQGHENPPTSAIFKKQIQRELLYQMSPLEDSTLASMVLKPFPIRAFSDVVFLNGKDVDKVPRVYIKTMHDKIILHEQQDLMIKRWHPSNVYIIDSDHCPFFSNPIQLFGFLVEIASKFSP